MFCTIHLLKTHFRTRYLTHTAVVNTYTVKSALSVIGNSTSQNRGTATALEVFIALSVIGVVVSISLCSSKEIRF